MCEAADMYEEMTNLVVLQDPAESYDRASGHEHRYPHDTKARLFNREIVQIVAYRRVGRETLFCPSVAVCLVQQGAGEESRDCPAKSKREVNETCLPLVQLVYINE